MAKCSSCGAQIGWGKTLAGKPMPIEPHAEGNLVIRAGRIHVLSAGENSQGETRFRSHFASCPNADRHRKQ